MRVCVIGTGYVGLVTGASLAHIGHHVICVDNNEEKVKLMKAGQTPIFEPGLSEIMQSASQDGRIEFTTNLGAGVAHGEVLFIAVGTPPLPTGESDTRYVEAVAREIGAYLDDSYKVIVNKLTVPIGSGDWVRMVVLDGIAERQKFLVSAGGVKSNEATVEMVAGFDVVSNPEFLREGSAVYDTFNPDRIVLGSNNPRAIALMQKLHASIGKTVGILGLTFKPNTDDMRDAPALKIIEHLNRLGTKVKAYDPIVSQTRMRHGSTGVAVETDPERLADRCDALVLMTEWQQFWNLDYGKMAQLMNNPVMVDGRNFLDREELQRAGFYYVGVGH